jgi:hypothetical protein
MSRNVEIYISNNRLDLFDFEEVSLTNAIKDIRDISKVFTDFSREITVPASKNNNKIFKHYDNWDIIDGFDARLRVDALIKVDGVDYKEGKVSLSGTSVRNGIVDSYTIIFYGKTVNLKDLMEDDMLDDLGSKKFEIGDTVLNNFTFTYSADFVQDCFMYGYYYSGGSLNSAPTTFPTTPIATDFDVCFPFISGESFYYLDDSDSRKLSPKDKVDSRNVHATASIDTDLRPKRGVWFKDLKPAVRIKWIIQAIEERYGLEFSNEFFNDNTNIVFDELFLFLHRESGNINKQLEETNAVFGLNNFSSTGFYDWKGQNVYSSTQSLETNELEFFANTEYPSGYTNTIIHRVTFDIDVAGDGDWSLLVENIYNNAPSRVLPVIDEKIYSEKGTSGVSYTVDIRQNILYPNTGFDIATPQFTITTQGGITAITSITNIEIERIELNRGVETSLGTATYTMTAPSLGVSKSNIVAQMPKMKVLDFLTSIFKKFNLTAYYEPINSVSEHAGKVRVRTLDEYYTDANLVDLTPYVDTSESRVDRFGIWKNIDYGFSEPKTFAIINANEIRSLIKNDTGGRYDFGNERVKLTIGDGSYETSLGFEKMMYERMSNQNTASPYDSKLTWGWSANREESAVLTNPILFYPIKTPVYGTNSGALDAGNDFITFDKSDYNEDGSREGSTDIDLVGTETITQNVVSFYIRPSNSHWMATYGENGYSLNFGSELDEHNRTTNNNSLYQTYHKTYIEDVYNERARIVNLTAYLPSNLIHSIRLNDEILIKNRRYGINKIDVNISTGKTKLELLSRIYRKVALPEINIGFNYDLNTYI